MFADLQGRTFGRVRISALLRRAADACRGRALCPRPTLRAGARALFDDDLHRLYRIYGGRKGASQWARDAATILAGRLSGTRRAAVGVGALGHILLLSPRQRLGNTRAGTVPGRDRRGEPTLRKMTIQPTSSSTTSWRRGWPN
jgi:hypothetical protein